MITYILATKSFYFSDKDVTIDLSRARVLYSNIKSGAFDYLTYSMDCSDFIKVFEELGFHRLEFKNKK